MPTNPIARLNSTLLQNKPLTEQISRDQKETQSYEPSYVQQSIERAEEEFEHKKI